MVHPMEPFRPVDRATSDGWREIDRQSAAPAVHIESFDRSCPNRRVLIAIAEDDLCLWFWQDITHAGSRPMVTESIAGACEALGVETDIRLVITNATPRKGSELLLRTADVKGIPYLIARPYRQGIRLLHKGGIGFEGDPSAMGDFLAEILRLHSSRWPREAN